MEGPTEGAADGVPVIVAWPQRGDRDHPTQDEPQDGRPTLP